MQFRLASGEQVAGVVIVDPETGEASKGALLQSYILLKAATATGQAVSNVRGGDYVWIVDGTFSSGVTATLQRLGLDDVTWKNVKSLSDGSIIAMQAAGQTVVMIGQGATMRVALSGAQTSPLHSSIAGAA